MKNLIKPALCAMTAFVMMFTAVPASASLNGIDNLQNPISPRSADPFVTYRDGYYYFCKSQGDASVGIAKSRRLQDIGVAPMKTVWTPADPNYNKEIWAPELFNLQGKWYIYVAADNGSNANHRMLVLESAAQDPAGSYTQKAVLDTQGWAIDGTVFEYNGQLYFVWAGWPGTVDGEQRLYIQRMTNPWTLDPAGSRVEISRPQYGWETVLAPNNALILNEGPEALIHGDKINIVYSANCSWRDDYLLGMISFDTSQGGDPLDASKWVKAPNPVFQQPAPADRTDIMAWGTGHASFTTSPDGTEYWMVYHAFTNDSGGWGSRSARAQRFTWNADDTPNFGTPVRYGGTVAPPSGQAGALSGYPAGISNISYESDMTTAGDWTPYGGYTPTVGAGGYAVPGNNTSGYKTVNLKTDFANFTYQLDVKLTAGTGNAGPLFRVTFPGSGVDNLNGYGAFLCWSGTPGSAFIELNRYGDGNGETTYRNIARVYCPDISYNTVYRMKVICEGYHIKVYLNGAEYVDVIDRVYTRGAVGFRTYLANASFANVQVISTGQETNAVYEGRQFPQTNAAAFTVDNFDGTAPSADWTVYNGGGNTSGVGGGYFNVNVAAGSGGFYDTQTSGTSVIRSAPAGDSYEAICSVNIPAAENYQQAGPVIWVDSDHYVKLTYAFVGNKKLTFASENWSGTNSNWLENTSDAAGAQDRVPGLANLVQTDVQYWGGGSNKTRSQNYIAGAGDTVTLKIVRNGNVYTGYFWDGAAWVLAAKPLTVALAGTPSIGFIAEGNGAPDAVTAKFNWFAYRALPSADTLAPAVVTTKIGEIPALPAAVTASGSDNSSRDVPAVWPAIGAPQVSSAGGFLVAGAAASGSGASESPCAAVIVKPALLTRTDANVVPKLTALSGPGVFNPEISVQNDGGVDLTAILIYAEYDPAGRLTNTSAVTKAVSAGGYVPLRAGAINARPGYSYRMFLWGGGFTPLTSITTEAAARACPAEPDNAALAYLVK